MKKCVDGKMIEMTAEEIKEREAQIVADTAMLKAITDAQTQKETDKANAPILAAEDKAKEDQAKALKDSAKAKLIAGEALTAEEADTIVL